MKCPTAKSRMWCSSMSHTKVSMFRGMTVCYSNLPISYQALEETFKMLSKWVTPSKKVAFIILKISFISYIYISWRCFFTVTINCALRKWSMSNIRMHVKIHFNLSQQYSDAWQSFQILFCYSFVLGTDWSLCSFKHSKGKKAPAYKCWIVLQFIWHLVLFDWHFFSISVGTKGAQNFRSSSGWIYSKVHYFIFFFCTILFYFSFLYVYCFYCCSLICFVYMCSSLCAYSVWLLRLPFRGFSSLMWSIQEEVVGCDGCYSCMSLWASFSSLCASVCFAWLNYIEVHLQILNVTFVGHLSHCQVK